MKITVSTPVQGMSRESQMRKKVVVVSDSSSAAQLILNISKEHETTDDIEIIIEGKEYMLYPDDDSDPICGSWPFGEGDEDFKEALKVRIDYLLEFHEAFYVE